ncbi:MAG: hypothetical protein HKN14_06380 [Marinicaulis sp.]|nr:hypothetical protein [Marinicaulis sp.]
MAIVDYHLSPRDKSAREDDDLKIAAEAVVNIYAALTEVTTREGQDRLRKALRPALGEILKDFVGSATSPTLDRAADLVTELYYQAW